MTVSDQLGAVELHDITNLQLVHGAHVQSQIRSRFWFAALFSISLFSNSL